MHGLDDFLCVFFAYIKKVKVNGKRATAQGMYFSLKGCSFLYESLSLCILHTLFLTSVAIK